MPRGLDRSGDFRNGSPITLPHEFGTPITEPHDFGNDVTWPTPDPAHFGNAVTWLPNPAHFGNIISPPYPAPTFTSVTPNNGPTSGGTPIAIVGSGFSATGLEVLIGGQPCTGVVASDDNNLSCDSPAGSVGSTDIEIITDGGSVDSPGAWTYDALAINLISHTTAATSGFGSTSLATAGIDTTGATFLAAYLEGYEGPYAYPFALMDSYGNEWVGLSIATENHTGQLFYSYQKIGGGACVVGPGHTFTLTQPGGPFFIATMYVEAFSGVQTSSDPLEGGSDQNLYGGYTGISETPANTGDLIVMGASGYNFTLPVSIDSGFTVTDDNQATGGAAESGAMAYLIAPSTSAVDPTWTTSAQISGTINGAVFAKA